jgi:hypothetical protein
MNISSVNSGNDPLWEILLRLVVEVTVLFIIIPVIYKRYSGNRENMFSFFLMGTVIFLLCAVLKKVEIQMGIALGLFAIFSIIRFRTSNFSMKDMAYLFTIMGISAINAMLDFPHPIRGTILFNSIIILTILLLELSFKEDKKPDEKKSEKKEKKEKEEKKKLPADLQLIYNNLTLLQPDKIDELMADISRITGKNISEVSIRKMDMINGIAELDVLFRKNTVLDNLQ